MKAKLSRDEIIKLLELKKIAHESLAILYDGNCLPLTRMEQLKEKALYRFIEVSSKTLSKRYITIGDVITMRLLAVKFKLIGLAMRAEIKLHTK